jgi:hypothetical protein
MPAWYQCRLRRGNVEIAAWVEGPGAFPSNMVQIADDTDWWRVVEILSPPIDLEPELIKRHRAAKLSTMDRWRRDPSPRH